jgi:hypothetical protein
MDVDGSVADGRKARWLRKRWVEFGTRCSDHPSWVAAGLIVAVAVHAASTLRWRWLDPYKSLVMEANTSTAVTLYLGAAAAAAIVAGFAGVIIVFTIGSEARRIRFFRFASGKSLQRAWMAVVAEPFAATLLGLVAAISQVTSGRRAAPWVFEVGLLLLVHGAALLLWLLRALMEIVYAEDTEADAKDREIPTDHLFPAENVD